jgi:hypothetical protein
MMPTKSFAVTLACASHCASSLAKGSAPFGPIHDTGGDVGIGLLEYVDHLAEDRKLRSTDLAELEFIPEIVTISDVTDSPHEKAGLPCLDCAHDEEASRARLDGALIDVDQGRRVLERHLHGLY